MSTTMTGSDSTMAASLEQPDSARLGTPRPFLRSLFTKLRPNEGKALALFFVYALLLLICYYVLKTIREPLLLDGGSAELKSYAYAAVAAILARHRAALRRAVPQDRAPPARPLDHALLRREPRGVLRRRSRRCGHRLRLLRVGRRVQRRDPHAVLGPCGPHVQGGERAAALPGDHGRRRSRRARRTDARADPVRGAR